MTNATSASKCETPDKLVVSNIVIPSILWAWGGANHSRPLDTNPTQEVYIFLIKTLKKLHLKQGSYQLSFQSLSLSQRLKSLLVADETIFRKGELL